MLGSRAFNSVMTLRQMGPTGAFRRKCASSFITKHLQNRLHAELHIIDTRIILLSICLQCPRTQINFIFIFGTGMNASTDFLELKHILLNSAKDIELKVELIERNT